MSDSREPEGDSDREPEVLVSMSLRFPNLDRRSIGEHLTPVVTEALKLGGLGFNLNIQPYDPHETD